MEDNLKDNINVIRIAIGMITEEDVSGLDHMRTYQREVKQLFSLERFAFVDEDGLVYTADEGVRDEIDQYSFDHATLSEPEISIKNVESPEKKVVIAVPIRERGFRIEGKPLAVCFMEIDMNVMLQGVSMKSQNSEATFCNIYTSDGIALSNTVLGGLAMEDNLLKAMSTAVYEDGYSFEGFLRDFQEGRKGVAAFSYNGIQETLAYVPVDGTYWFLTYLIRESVISERIGSVSSGIITRSVIQSLLAALVLGGMFTFIIHQNRKNARLMLEKETSEAENRVKHEELAQRISLQEQLLAQKAELEQQEKMITALASDYRSVYYVELDKNKGVCYQARSDLPGFHAGESFDYLEAVTAYCNQYILPGYREDFLRFVQPDNIREGLKESRVISYRYMICVDGKESYESVRFAGVRHPEDRDDHTVHNVGACFTDVDAETRKALAHRRELSEALNVAEEARQAGVDTFVPKLLFAGNVLEQFREAFNRKNEALSGKRADLAGRRVLLAEDTVVNAEIMVMLLNMKQMDVDVAENGQIAVEMFLKHPEGYYDAILMDMRMPVIDGLEATRQIRASGRPDAKTVPMIALTANAFDEDVQRSMQAGLNAHLSKPVEPQALFDTLESLIGALRP